MKPRSLRHRLEKISRMLLTIQKHAPDAECVLDENKGEHGHIVVNFTDSADSRTQISHLGKDLEGKNYNFQETVSPWLGQVAYTGRAEDKPAIILTMPILKDRLAVSDATQRRSFSFSEA